MKKIILISIALIFCASLNAQTETDQDSVQTSKADTTRLKFGDVKLLVITGFDKAEKNDTIKGEINKEKRKTNSRKNHWAGIDIGIAGYLSPQQSFGMEFENQLFELDYARSRTWNINFLEKNLKIYKNYVGIVTGAGVSFNRYHFNNRQTALTPFTDSTYMVETNLLTRKHLLSASYLTVPLLIEFNTHRNPDKSFHIATGVIGGYRIGSKAIQVNEFEGSKSRLSIRDDFNLAPFNLNATVRVGYGDFNLFVTYALTEMFVKGRGPELFPVSAGITLLGF
ncbi:MAG: PorT family protein [Bacteroidota bacterium]|nr:PorT family protein [Bacteroidota bacterium]